MRTVQEIGQCNDWQYFLTVTFSPDLVRDRYDLDETVGRFRRRVHNINRRRTEAVKYCVVPEKHKDGAYHLHGFISGLLDDDMTINANGYRDCPLFSDSLGYISLSPIRNREACARYVSKYVTKSIASYEEDARLFYASQGLARAEHIDLAGVDSVGCACFLQSALEAAEGEGRPGVTAYANEWGYGFSIDERAADVQAAFLQWLAPRIQWADIVADEVRHPTRKK